jgi:acyl-CoA reductase-like NAD-dependent aldehyde dehydrogenase
VTHDQLHTSGYNGLVDVVRIPVWLHIGGEWVPPVEGLYFDNPTPVTGQTFCEVPRSDEADIEKALDAAHAAASHARTTR